MSVIEMESEMAILNLFELSAVQSMSALIASVQSKTKTKLTILETVHR